jgi:hypothetical protein
LNPFPRKLEIRSARRDHAELGVGVAGSFFFVKRFRYGVVKCGGPFDPFRPSQDDFDGPLVLINGVEAGEDVPEKNKKEKP